MAKAKNTSLVYLIYNDLVGAVKGVGEKTFLYRPKTLKEELTSFVVVDLPTELIGRVKGSIDFSAGCYGTFSVFCKAKTDDTPNIDAQSTLVQNILDLFPINGKHISAASPRVLLQGADGHGYQVTQITFKLRTKINARNIK